MDDHRDGQHEAKRRVPGIDVSVYDSQRYLPAAEIAMERCDLRGYSRHVTAREWNNVNSCCFGSLQEQAAVGLVSGELVDATKQTVDQAAEALRLASERYRVGSATQLDVQTSQVSLTQARTNQLQSNYNYLVAVAGVRQAEGLSDVLVSN